MTAAEFLPHVNASLNLLSTFLLVMAFIFIKFGFREVHSILMLAAIGVSAIFLLSYLIYHFSAPIFVFPGEAMWENVLYYSILVTHVILAAIVTPLIFVTARAGLRGEFKLHPRLARWTFPVWLYVTVTGVVIYYMLYHHYS